MKKLVVALAVIGALAFATPALAGHNQPSFGPAVYHSSYGGPAYYGPGVTYASGYGYGFPANRGYYAGNPGLHRGHFGNPGLHRGHHRWGFPFFWGRTDRSHDHSRCNAYNPWGQRAANYRGGHAWYPYYGGRAIKNNHGNNRWKHNKHTDRNHDQDGDWSNHHRRHDR